VEKKNLQMDARGQWSLQVLGWLMVASWFCASLLSQAMYMAVNGMPYGPEVLIAKLGVYYWIIAGIEVVIWGLVAILVYSKMRKMKQSTPNLMVPAR
jgi:multisubunit Na+/H+ antiporter MnhB subunit